MPALTLTAKEVGFIPKMDGVRRRRGSRSFTISRLLLLAALVASPLAFGAVRAWAWAFLAVVVVLALLLWGLGSVRAGELTLFWSPLYLPGILFFLWGGVQLASHLTLDPIATREALLKLATDFLLFFLAGQLAVTASPKVWRHFGLLGAVFGFALAMFSILQFCSSQGLIYWSIKADGWAFGPYVNHNHYAGLMEMLIPVSIAYVLSRPRSHPARAMLAFAASVPIVSLLLSASRGGMLSLLAEVMILGVILWSCRATTDWLKLGVAGALVLLTALLLFFWLDPGEISGRLATVVKLARPADVDMTQRQAVALDSLRILRHRPWAGTGLGSFEMAYPQYQSFPSEFIWDHAHNDYAEALVESGLLGGVLIFVALAMFLGLSFRGLAERIRREAGQIQLGAALGCCGLLVHSAFDFNLHVPANAAWFVVCAAGATTRFEQLVPIQTATVLAWGNGKRMHQPPNGERVR